MSEEKLPLVKDQLIMKDKEKEHLIYDEINDALHEDRIFTPEVDSVVTAQGGMHNTIIDVSESAAILTSLWILKPE